MVPQEERNHVLFSLLKENDKVVTGPGGKNFWLMAPPSVEVRVAPDDGELPRTQRAQSVLEWRLRIRGIGTSQARSWVEKPPTARHSKYQVYVNCKTEAESVRQQPGTFLSHEGELEVVGSPKEYARPYRYKTVLDAETFGELIGHLHEAVRTGNRIGLDVEADTRGKIEKGRHRPDPRKDILIGIGFSFTKDINYYVPLNGPLNPDAVLNGLNHSAPSLRWVGWNAGYDALVARRRGLAIPPACADGQAAAVVLQRETRTLKGTVHEVLGHLMQTFDELLDANSATQVSQIDPEQVAPYCCGDAYFGLDATTQLEEKIAADPQASQSQLYWELEMPVHGLLVDMMEEGLPLDLTAILNDLVEIEKKKALLLGGIRATTGNPQFNPDSPQQVAHWLYEVKKFPVQGYTGANQPTTDIRALLRLRKYDPYSIQLLVMWRHYTKITQTYLLKWMRQHRDDGTIVTLWGQYLVASGRFSSRDPNLQNLPLELRKYVVGDFCVADYSQLEMRIAAFLSQEPALIEVYRKDGDVHDETCMRVFGKHRDSDYSLNVASKALNFAGLLYGAGGHKIQLLIERQALLRPELNIEIPSIPECNGWLRESAKAYPRHQEWKNNVVLPFMRERGYSVTAYGRRRVVPDIHSTDTERRMEAEREGINHTIQGTAGDVVKRGMISVARIPGGKILLQNHDELLNKLIGLIGERKEGYRVEMKEAMELGQPFARGGVELKVEPVLCSNWKEAK